jgi:hypothetical protein
LLRARTAANRTPPPGPAETVEKPESVQCSDRSVERFTVKSGPVVNTVDFEVVSQVCRLREGHQAHRAVTEGWGKAGGTSKGEARNANAIVLNRTGEQPQHVGDTGGPGGAVLALQKRYLDDRLGGAATGHSGFLNYVSGHQAGEPRDQTGGNYAGERALPGAPGPPEVTVLCRED